MPRVQWNRKAKQPTKTMSDTPETDIENTQDTDAIGIVCSALVRPSFTLGSDDDGEPDFRSLVGPGGWECYLGEPEDALWCRDGEDAMNMLNELAARVRILSDFARTAPGRLPSSVQSALWPNVTAMASTGEKTPPKETTL